MVSRAGLFDVIICGFGPSGVVAANLLGQQGVRVLVVERRSEIVSFPRAVHFDGEVMRIFQSLDLVGDIKTVTRPAAGVRYINARGATLIEADFSGEQVRHGWERGHYFSQPELEAVLRTNLKRYNTVEVRLGWELFAFRQTHAGVEADIRRTVDGGSETLASQYLLACDGGSSGVRERLGGRMRSLGQSSNWLVCDTLLDRDIDAGRPMYQVCDPARPVTVEPCNGRHVRWEFRILPSDSSGQLESEAYARRLMRPYLRLVDPDLHPSSLRMVRSKIYTFRSEVAGRWRFNRVFLLGDAAHLMPPFLGQGMCAGLRDAFNLSWKLAGVLHGEYAMSLLDTYESERSPHVASAIRDAAGIAAAIQADNVLSASLRDLYLWMRSSLPFLARPMESEASWSLGAGLFDEDGAKAPARDRRNLFDQPIVESHQGGRKRLDDLLGPGFALLFLGHDPERIMTAEQAAYWHELNARFIRVFLGKSRVDPGTALADSGGTLAAWASRVGGVDVAVVRPDRQVFGLYRGSPAELAAGLERARKRLAAGLGKSAHRNA